MEKLLVIDSCMREGSRTRIILDAAMSVLSLRYEVETIDVNAVSLPPLTPETLQARNSGEVSEIALELAKKVAAADRIVVAAPFWDMSFPSVLKAFFENVSLCGVTFSDDGQTCTGLCKCEKLLYITTRGMDIPTGEARDQGTSYLKALSSLWGLGEVMTVAAWNLDYMDAETLGRKVKETSELVRNVATDF